MAPYRLMPVWPYNPHAHASNHRVTSGGFKNAPPASAEDIFFFIFVLVSSKNQCAPGHTSLGLGLEDLSPRRNGPYFSSKQITARNKQAKAGNGSKK